VHGEKGQLGVAQSRRARARSRAQQRRHNGSRLVWRQRRGVLSVRRWQGGDLDGGRINVATWHTRACQRTPVMWLRMRAGRLRRGLDGVLSAMTARPAERPARGLRHRAPSVGTPAGAATGGSRAAAAVMGRHSAPQPTRRLRGGGGRCTRGHP
jgi:hypothetical protein